MILVFVPGPPVVRIWAPVRYSTRFIAECVSEDHFQLFGLSSLLWSPDPSLLFVGTPSAERHIGERNGPNVIFLIF